MKLQRAQHRRQMDINMTPMIDVVFQLLIFFMTCTQVSEANREPLELPKQSGSRDQTQGDVTINIRADGSIHLSGEPASVAEIITVCGEEVQRTHGGDWEQLTVVIRTDRRSACRPVNELITAFTKLGVRKVRLAVQTE
jgi:biopolymer transport protein ExbD